MLYYKQYTSINVDICLNSNVILVYLYELVYQLSYRIRLKGIIFCSNAFTKKRNKKGSIQLKLVFKQWLKTKNINGQTHTKKW